MCLCVCMFVHACKRRMRRRVVLYTMLYIVTRDHNFSYSFVGPGMIYQKDDIFRIKYVSERKHDINC